MIKIKKHRWLPSLKKQWEELCKNNSLMSPNQQYDFVLTEWKNYFMYCYWERMIPEFWEVMEDGKTILIAPLCKKKNGTYKIFGRVNGCGVCDFIYNENTNVKNCLVGGGLLNKINGKVFLSRIKPWSKLYEATSELSGNVKLIDHVRIPFSDDYLLYYNDLHKSVRQNIRTAYNRTIKDGANLKIVILNGNNAVSADIVDGFNGVRHYEELHNTKKERRVFFSQMMEVYFKRHEQRYGVRTNRYKRWYLGHLNFTTKNLKKLPYAISVMLFINGQLAAFMGGFLNYDGSEYLIPRLSIDEIFNFYSPGVILIMEAVRYFSAETHCRLLDLSEGAEGYKLSMGGEIYQSAEYWINNVNTIER